MKKITIALMIFLLLPTTSCNGSTDIYIAETEPEDTAEIRIITNGSGSHMAYKSWDEILAKPDLVVCCEIVSNDGVYITGGYTEDDFAKIEEQAKEDSKEASDIIMSIRTRYKAKVTAIYYSGDEKVYCAEGDEIAVSYTGGVVNGVKYVDRDSEEYKVGSKYILFLKKNIYEEDIYFIFNVRFGWAEVLEDSEPMFRVCDSENTLYDGITSLEALADVIKKHASTD